MDVQAVADAMNGATSAELVGLVLRLDNLTASALYHACVGRAGG